MEEVPPENIQSDSDLDGQLNKQSEETAPSGDGGNEAASGFTGIASLVNLDEQIGRAIFDTEVGETPTQAKSEGESLLRASLDFSVPLAFLEGHFPGAPVWPGAFLLKLVVLVLRQATCKNYRLSTVQEMKFLQLVTPGLQLMLQAALAPPVVRESESTGTECGEAGLEILNYNGSIVGPDGTIYVKFRLSVAAPDSD